MRSRNAWSESECAHNTTRVLLLQQNTKSRREYEFYSHKVDFIAGEGPTNENAVAKAHDEVDDSSAVRNLWGSDMLLLEGHWVLGNFGSVGSRVLRDDVLIESQCGANANPTMATSTTFGHSV